MVKRAFLYLTATLIWGIPGVIITIKGVTAYATLADIRWWLIAITAAVLAMFYTIFHRVVARYSARIAALPARAHLWQTFSLRGWLLILFMMCLGITLRFIPHIPQEFTASFYSGLGPMLILSALKFLKLSYRD